MVRLKTKILIVSALLSILIFNSTININATQNSTYVPNILKGIQELDEYKSIFKDLKRIRTNMYSIDLSESSITNRSGEIIQQIDFYSNQIKTLRRELQILKTTHANSQPDVYLASKLDLIAYTFEISLQQQKALIQAIKKGDELPDKIFFSNYINNIYYYLSLGDSLIAYIDNYYNL